MEAILSVFANLVPTIGLRRIRRFPEKPAPASSTNPGSLKRAVTGRTSRPRDPAR